MDTQQILQLFSSNFKLDTILGRIIRELLWSIVKILGYIVDSISAVTSKLFVLDSFYSNPNVINFINSFKPLIVVLFAISFCIVGYQSMFSQTKQFRKIGINVLIAISVILVLPMAMDKMNTLTNLGVTAVIGSPSIVANDIIKENIIDLVTYDTANFNSDAIKQLTSGNKIKVENISQIDPTSLMEPDTYNNMQLNNEDVFTKKLVVNKDGEMEVGDLNQGWMTFWKEYYYRYNINFLIIIISLGVIGATLVFTCLKLGTLIFELGYNKLLAILIAPADINNGQRTKQIIQNILSIFVVTFLIAVLLKFYVLFIGMVATVKGIESVVLLVAGSFAVIEGPNIVEKLFGIDAGLHSGFKTVAGAYLAGKAIAGGASKFGNTAKSIASSSGKAVGSVVGGSAGMASGLKGNNKKSNENSMYSDMKKENGDSSKEKSLYPDMDKKATEQELDHPKSEPNSDATSEPRNNSNGINGSGGNNVSKNTSEPLHTTGTKGSNNGSKNTNSSGSQKPPSLYSEMGSNGDNKPGGHAVTEPRPETAPESINTGNISSPNDDNKQTTGQYVKNKIREKVQHNGIYKQTVKSYNLGRNTAQSIRNKNSNDENK